jgi:hypothetical protein
MAKWPLQEMGQYKHQEILSQCLFRKRRRTQMVDGSCGYETGQMQDCYIQITTYASRQDPNAEYTSAEYTAPNTLRHIATSNAVSRQGAAA